MKFFKVQDEFNPEKDPFIAKNYNSKNFISGKKENKKELLHRFNLLDESLITFNLEGLDCSIEYGKLKEAISSSAVNSQ